MQQNRPAAPARKGSLLDRNQANQHDQHAQNVAHFRMAALRFRLIAYPMSLCNPLNVLELQVSVRQVYESQKQTEQQAKKTVTPPEIAPVSESSESKRAKHGRKRPGAGRKPNLARRLLKGFSRDAIAEAMADVDVGMVVTSLLKSKREKTRLQTLIFVRDTLIGRPAQNVSLSGGVLHAQTVWRPLADLTDEEMAMLDKLTKKLTAPGSNASPNAPQNQTESKPAIEAVTVEPSAD